VDSVFLVSTVGALEEVAMERVDICFSMREGEKDLSSSLNHKNPTIDKMRMNQKRRKLKNNILRSNLEMQLVQRTNLTESLWMF
jgi:hypothetical protein